MKDNFYHMFEQNIQRDIEFAAKYGYKVFESQGVWRVYKKNLIDGLEDVQVAMTTTRYDAAKVAYALAAVAASKM